MSFSNIFETIFTLFFLKHPRDENFLPSQISQQLCHKAEYSAVKLKGPNLKFVCFFFSNFPETIKCYRIGHIFTDDSCVVVLRF
jgi:hypothetical protein